MEDRGGGKKSISVSSRVAVKSSTPPTTPPPGSSLPGLPGPAKLGKRKKKACVILRSVQRRITPYFPTTNGGTQKWKLGRNMCTFCVHGDFFFFARFGTDLHAQSVLSNKISASELRRKFVKGPLSVGLIPWQPCLPGAVRA